MSATRTSGVDKKNDSPAAETDPTVIAQNIEHTRDDMTETLDAIQQRLEPEQVTEYVKDVAHHVIIEVKDAVRELAGEAKGAIHEAAAKKKDQPDARSGVSAPNGQQKRIAGQAKQMAGQATEQMQEKAGQMQDQAQGFWQKLQANPIAIGALGVALGGIAGAIVPETEKENQLMGETRDRVVGSVQEVTGQSIDSVKSIAEDAGNTVMEEAKSQGMAPKSGSASRAPA